MVLNDLTRFGLRRLHVVRDGQPVEQDTWLEYVPIQAQPTISRLVRFEKSLGIHHLELWWKARECVVLVEPDTGREVEAVLWFVGDGDLQLAVDLFELVYERDARVIWAQAPVAVDGLAFEVRTWVPDGFVVVTDLEVNNGRENE